MKTSGKITLCKKSVLSGLFLFFILLSVPSGHALAQCDRFTEQDIRDAILEFRVFTSEQLNDMDLNHDDRLDVADIVSWIRVCSPLTPVASFERSVSDAEEGADTVYVKVGFSTHFSGTLRYCVSGTAGESADYEMLNGTIPADGVYVNIPITVSDDDDLEETAETILLTLCYDAAENPGYVPGVSSDHTIYIYDNDALWNGTIENNGTALHFQMKIIQGLSGTSGGLVTDGHGIIPLNGSGAEWPADHIAFDKTSFNATVDQIDIPQTLTLTDAELKRKLVFQADPKQAGHIVDPDSEIRGTLQESVTCASQAHLGYDTVGSFILLKQIPNIEIQQPPLEDAR